MPTKNNPLTLIVCTSEEQEILTKSETPLTRFHLTHFNCYFARRIIKMPTGQQ